MTGKIIKYDGDKLIIVPSEPIERTLLQQECTTVEIRLNDGRAISAEQRAKIFAIIRDISLWCGHVPEDIRNILTWDFTGAQDIDYFSLSDTDMSTAREFINYLIDFCLRHKIPTKKPLITQSDDIGRYLYACLEHKRCAICNMDAEVHHVDRVGIGNNRNKINHEGMRAIALCRKHHTEAHNDEQAFMDRHNVFGIKLDKYLRKALNLGKGG